MKALVRLKEVTRPLSEETIGFRLQAAIPNSAGKAFGKEVASFRGDYLILESSDHSATELEAGNAFQRIVEGFASDLRRFGYTEFEWRKAG